MYVYVCMRWDDWIKKKKKKKKKEGKWIGLRWIRWEINVKKTKNVIHIFKDIEHVNKKNNKVFLQIKKSKRK